MDKLCHVATTSVLRGTTYLKKTYQKKKKIAQKGKLHIFVAFAVLYVASSILALCLDMLIKCKKEARTIA